MHDFYCLQFIFVRETDHTRITSISPIDVLCVCVWALRTWLCVSQSTLYCLWFTWCAIGPRNFWFPRNISSMIDSFFMNEKKNQKKTNEPGNVKPFYWILWSVTVVVRLLIEVLWFFLSKENGNQSSVFLINKISVLTFRHNIFFPFSSLCEYSFACLWVNVCANRKCLSAWHRFNRNLPQKENEAKFSGFYRSSLPMRHGPCHKDLQFQLILIAIEWNETKKKK